MSAIRSRDTKAELRLRRELRCRNLIGYRCSPKSVYGRPDVAFTRWKVAIFVDGCFWHGCPVCYVRPVGNREFWDTKLGMNVARDRQVDEELERQGWVVLRFWEHEVMDSPSEVAESVRGALLNAGRSLA